MKSTNTTGIPHPQPRVSVIVPCRNEEDFISGCLDSLCNSAYPLHKLEIIVVDGMSDDHTREIAGRYLDRCPGMKIISNPARIFPAAVNAGVREATGEVIVIAGAHAVYAPDYLSICVSHLYSLKASNTGGVLHTVGRNTGFMPGLISAVLSSPFGVGNATFRTGAGKITETDTVFGGCYPREVFSHIGGFNENLVSTSDMDFNSRLRRSGGKIYLIPQAVVTYYTRTRFRDFVKNNFRNGYWAIYPLRFTKAVPVSLRHFIPLLFVSGMGTLGMAGLLHPVFWLLLAALAAIYLAAASVVALREAFRGKPLHAALMPLMFLLLHVSYGAASFFALAKVIFLKRKINHDTPSRPV